jgi:hypothetical protein
MTPNDETTTILRIAGMHLPNYTKNSTIWIFIAVEILKYFLYVIWFAYIAGEPGIVYYNIMIWCFVRKHRQLWFCGCLRRKKRNWLTDWLHCGRLPQPISACEVLCGLFDQIVIYVYTLAFFLLWCHLSEKRDQTSREVWNVLNLQWIQTLVFSWPSLQAALITRANRSSSVSADCTADMSGTISSSVHQYSKINLDEQLRPVGTWGLVVCCFFHWTSLLVQLLPLEALWMLHLTVTAFRYDGITFSGQSRWRWALRYQGQIGECLQWTQKWPKHSQF